MAWVRTIFGLAGTTTLGPGIIQGTTLELTGATNQIALDSDAVNVGTISMATLTADRTWTLPDATDTLVGKATTDTLTNKTLASPVVLDQATGDYTLTWADPAAARAISIPDPGGADSFAFLAATQTLTNKTINSLVTDNSASRITGQNRFRTLQSMVRVKRTANEALVAATPETINWDDEDFDTDTLHDTVTNNSRLTAQIAGKYLAIFNGKTDANGILIMKINKNGTTVAVQRISNATATGGSLSTIVSLAATDYLEANIESSVNGNLVAADSSFMMTYLGE